ncbi:DUF6792 domain-containing protein [Bacillus weihaiensis]|uniref:DUF6792 domain-containing protein n=1 Tax=Bacillus weihaiensis TaxID=1547283 RepID=A0A1L3MRP8_9BACI|nr:DUF6792 domain-containing protein [Bacillus weihaiensis]APH05006.1 hypothetical protein A9C19_09735 [Bacillus weihaiensis]
MNNLELFNTEMLKARIMNLEYDNLIEKEVVSEIKRIYFEETGKELPAEITIYRSDEILKTLKNSNIDSGFDGTVIHLKSNEEKINQSITITRGSELGEKDTWRPIDWSYNIIGIFVGGTDNQYNDARKFDDTVTSIIKKQDSDLPKLEKYGYGHSLGGNTITLLQLLSEGKFLPFKKVYAINDAAPTAYQLYSIDPKFSRYLNFKFKIITEQDIYKIPPDELKAFTEEYYKNKIDESTIHHLTSEEDMLYGASSVRGFLEIGGRDGFLDTDPRFAGIRELVDKIPDKDLRTIQMFLSNYSIAYNKEGFDGFMKSLTGFNPAVVDSALMKWEEFNETVSKIEKSVDGFGKPFAEIKDADSFWDFAKESLTLPFDLVGAKMNLQKELIAGAFQTLANVTTLIGEAVPMIIDMARRIPEIVKAVKLIYQDLDPILQAFVDVGYISQIEKDDIMKNLKEIESSLLAIQSTIEDTLDPTLLLALNSMDFKSQVEKTKEISAAFQKIKSEVEDIEEAFEGLKNINTSFLENFSVSAHAHGLDAVINALVKDKNISYANNDMYMSPTGKGEIKINISSSVRIYQKGLAISEEKETNVRTLKSLFETNFLDDYDERKQKIITKISIMESNPTNYSYLLSQSVWSPPGGYYKLTSINVNEELLPLPASFHQSFSQMIDTIQGEIEKEKMLVKKIRDSIEDLFAEEEKISNMFDYHYGG